MQGSRNQHRMHRSGSEKEEEIRRASETSSEEEGKPPGAGGPARDLELELDRETEEPVEAVEGDVSDVPDVGRPPDLHLVDGRGDVLVPLHSAGHHGPP